MIRGTADGMVAGTAVGMIPGFTARPAIGATVRPRFRLGLGGFVCRLLGARLGVGVRVIGDPVIGVVAYWGHHHHHHHYYASPYRHYSAGLRTTGSGGRSSGYRSSGSRSSMASSGTRSDIFFAK